MPDTQPTPAVHPPQVPMQPTSQPTKPRTRILLAMVAVVALLIVGGAFAANALSHQPIPTKPTPTVDTLATANASSTANALENTQLTQWAATAAVQAMTPTAPPVTPATDIGNTQYIGVWTVTLNKVYTATSGEYTTPKAGDIFVVVDVTAVNTSSSPQLMSSGALFVFQDESGQAYNETITGIGVPPDGTVPAGKKLRGQIAYEVPRSLHSFTLEFQDSLYNGNTATWSFSI